MMAMALAEEAVVELELELWVGEKVEDGRGRRRSALKIATPTEHLGLLRTAIRR